MPTLGQALEFLEEERFTGRQHELLTFRQWLSIRDQPILFVSGPGGIGKSWLLSAFGREAVAQRRDIVRCNMAAVEPRSDAITKSLVGETDIEVAIEVLNETRPVIVVDTFEAMGALTGFFRDEFLAKLDGESQVVLAGRHPLGPDWSGWEAQVHALPLAGLSSAERRAYLRARGLDNDVLIGQICEAVGGHPLGLALAADLSMNPAPLEFGRSRKWHDSVVRLVDALIPPSSDPGVRELLEAAAVLGRFDEDGLAATVGRSVTADLDALGKLSVLTRSDGRLALHDEIRRVVIHDLGVRAPRRLTSLRRGALRHLRSERSAVGRVDARCAADHMTLIFSALGLSHYYEEVETDLSIDKGIPDDFEDLVALQANMAQLDLLTPQDEIRPELLQVLLGHPCATVRVARARDGEAVAYGFIVPLAADTVDLFPADGPLSRFLPDVLTETGLESLEASAVDSNIWYMSNIVRADATDFGVIGEMVRDIAPVFFNAGVYVAVSSDPAYQQAITTLGGRPVAHLGGQGPTSLVGLVWDASRTGLDAWAQSSMCKAGPEPLPLGDELQAQLERLERDWEDDDALAASVVGRLAEPDLDATVAARAAAARALIGRARLAEGRVPSLEWRIRQEMSPALKAVSAQGLSLGDETSEWTIRLLGGFWVEHSGQVIDVGERVLARVVKLVAVRGRIPAEELCEELWPELAPGSGGVRLRSRLASLRRVAGEGLIVRKGAYLSLGPSVTVDANTFSQAAANALRAGKDGSHEASDLAHKALGHYSGELLPADRYLDWSDVLREKVRRQYLELLDFLAQDAVKAGDLEAAMRRIEEAIATEPYDEERYLQAVRLLAERGLNARARGMVQRARRMTSELGMPPSNALVQAEASLT